MPTLQCMNYKLQLAVKNNYTSVHTFVETKEMLDVLFRSLTNSGRSWCIYQWITEALDPAPVHFTHAGRTRFQPHTLSALSSFLRNFLVTMFFCQECRAHRIPLWQKKCILK